VSKEEIGDIRTAAKGRCFYCGQKARLSLDHVIPLALGGKHEKANLVMACLSCNSSKNDSPPEVYAAKIGRLLI